MEQAPAPFAWSIDLSPEPPPWWTVCEYLDEAIRKAARKSEGYQVTYYLNVLDLVDVEAAAYWRETGLSLQRNYRPC
jgi:hypothetical protein